MADWTQAEDNYLIRYMEDGNYSQVVIDIDASDVTAQHPGLTTVADSNLVTNVTLQGNEPDEPGRRITKWLWPYKGMGIAPLYLNAAGTRSSNPNYANHVVGIYLTDSDNGEFPSPLGGGQLKGWCDGETTGTKAVLYLHAGHNDSELFNHGGRDFYFNTSVAGHGHSGHPGEPPSYNELFLVSDIPYSPNAISSEFVNFDGSSINQSMEDWHHALSGTSGGSKHFKIVVRMGSDFDEWWDFDVLNRSYYVLNLNKTLIKKLITDPEYHYLEYWWGGGAHAGYFDSGGNLIQSLSHGSVGSRYDDGHGTSGEGGLLDDQKTMPAWNLEQFALRIYAPEADAYSRTEFPTEDPIGEVDGMNWPVWSDLNNDPNLQNLHPEKQIDYISLTNSGIDFDHNDIDDFRPISHVWTDVGEGTYNLQSFYDFSDPDYQYTGAPNIVNLAFDIADDYYSGPAYVENQWFSDHDSGYKFFVMRWGDEDDFKEDDDLIIEIEDKGSGFWEHHDINETVSKTYLEQGVYTIQVMVYSWIRHPDDEFIMACRWKIVNIRFNINEGTLSVIDFQDLGSEQFNVLPWPTPGAIPIIGGISQNSKYYKSVDAVYEGSEFGSADYTDLNRLKSARRNDELGDHLGQIDLEQTRVFTAPYDMHDLLMINQERDENTGDLLTYTFEEWHPYWDDGYWVGGYNDDGQPDTAAAAFPLDGESCVGIQYITNSPTRALRDTCVIELNTGELARGAIFDSSGIGNVGFVLGDYTVDKKDKNMKLARDSFIDRAEIGAKDKAI